MIKSVEQGVKNYRRARKSYLAHIASGCRSGEEKGWFHGAAATLELTSYELDQLEQEIMEELFPALKERK